MPLIRSLSAYTVRSDKGNTLLALMSVVVLAVSLWNHIYHLEADVQKEEANVAPVSLQRPTMIWIQYSHETRWCAQ